MHQQRRGFDADFFAHLHIDRLRSEAAPLDPALIHAQQHVRPIAGLRPARARVDGEKRIRAIVFAGKKLAQLEFFQLVNETRMFCRDFLFRLRALRWVCFFRGELP